uniref:Uncharacterized protein n=1 Tax=Malurus cyaneus samueli TaxID=2593467 RepID=A0A8C5U2C4_9PASS
TALNQVLRGDFTCTGVVNQLFKASKRIRSWPRVRGAAPSSLHGAGAPAAFSCCLLLGAALSGAAVSSTLPGQERSE